MLNNSRRRFSRIAGVRARIARAVAAGMNPSQGARSRGVAPVEMLEARTLLTGLTIVPNFASNITSDPKAGQIEAAINAGINQIDSLFSTPITVHIKFQEGGGLGGSSTYFFTYSYTAYRAAVIAHATDENDFSALISLPAGTKNPVNGSTSVDVTTANARALGLTTGSGPGGIDSTITLNTAICNLTRSSINPSDYDLQSVAMHEMDEALGIGSALTGVENGAATPTGAIRGEDLYRYGSNGQRNFSTSATDAAYFSIDGGSEDLARYNQHYDGDYNDWYSYYGGEVPQVQDAYGTQGVIPYYNVEPTVLDVLGYTPTRTLGTGLVTGNVFNDINGNGTQNTGEPDLSGWTVEAVQGGKVITSDQSTALGYQLDSLPDGTYTIEEVRQSGYTQTTPASSYTVTISGHNDTVSGKNFGDTSTLRFNMTASRNNITLEVDPSDASDLEILSGSTSVDIVNFDLFSSVIVTGANSVTNSLTVNYGHGFFGQPVTFNGGTGSGATNSLSVLDDATTGTRQWDIGSSLIFALDTGLSLNPTVNFNGVQHVGLTGRSSGEETFVSQNTSHTGITLPTTTTVHINGGDTVNVRGTSDLFVIDGTGDATGEGINVGSLAPSLGGTLASINGSVTVNNVSTLTLDDSGDTTARSGTLSAATSLSGFGLPSSVSVNYTGALAALDVHTGSNATVDVTGTNTTTTLYPGSDSTVNVEKTSNVLDIDGSGEASGETVNIGSLAPSLGGTLANISGAVSVTNVSNLSVDDSGDTATRTATLSATSIKGFDLPSASSIGYSDLALLTIHGGADTVAVTGTGTTTDLDIGSKSTVNVQKTTDDLTINGNKLADTITVGSLAPALGGNLTGIAGSITISNDVGPLTVDDSGDTAIRTGGISGSTITGFGMPSSVGINYTNSLSSLAVHGGKGQNTETVTGTSVPTTLFAGALDATTVNVRATTAALTINGNGLTDTVNIGSLASSLGGTLTNIAGAVTVTNTSATSTLSLDDSGDSVGRTGVISPTEVTGFGLPAKSSVHYTSELATLTVRAGKGANTDTVAGTSVPTTLFAGAGDASTVNVQATTAALAINGDDTSDTIDIGSLAPSLGGTLTQIAGSITVTNTSDTSTLLLDDSGDDHSRAGTLSKTVFTGIGMASGASVNYTGSELASLTIHGGKAGGTLTETGTSCPTTVTGLTVVT